MKGGGGTGAQVGSVLAYKVVTLLDVAFVVFFLSDEATVGGELLGVGGWVGAWKWVCVGVWGGINVWVLGVCERQVCENVEIVVPNAPPYPPTLPNTQTVPHTRLYASWHTTNDCCASSIRVCTWRCCPSTCACTLCRLSNFACMSDLSRDSSSSVRWAWVGGG